MAENSSEPDNEYKPPEKKRREERNRELLSSVSSTSSSISRHDWCYDIPENVSDFKLIHLDRLGLFYADKPEFSLEQLLNKTTSCVVEVPELEGDFKIIVEFLKEYLFFTASHYKDHRDKEKLIQDMLIIHKNFKKLQELLLKDFHPDVNEKVELTRMLENVHVAAMEFLEMVMYFMEEEAKKSGTFCFDMMYRELLSTFFPACGLSVRAGECVKKSLILESGHIISEPDLRCRLNRQLFLDTDGQLVFNTLNQDTMMIVGEAKRRKGERIQSENFSIVRDLCSYDVLGQHGGELLLELEDSCFLRKEGGNRLVFGAIGAGTQIIFTALEMTRDHFEAILECDAKKPNEDDFPKALIHYTRPYDLLRAEDRQLLYEPIVRLACVQKRLKKFSR